MQKRKQPEPLLEPLDKERESGYRKGSILRIKLENFVEFRPGPRLNVVVGPNGTGKSTIVCAIALGLGALPSEGEYIKTGSTWCTIEIELKGDKKNYVIKRKITKKDSGGDSSECAGKHCPGKDVKMLVNSLDIQVDNLCQFLPQDRVASFAKLNEFELLREVEKAVGEKEDFYERHQSIIDRQGNVNKAEQELDTLKKTHKDLKARNEMLQRDVLRYRESQKLTAKLANLEAKKPWLIFERHRAQTKELNEITEKAKAEMKEREARHEPLKARLAEQEMQLAQADAERKGIAERLKKLDQERKTLGAKLEEQETKYEEVYNELERAKEGAAERKKRIDRIKSEIAATNEELSGLRPLDEINRETDSKNADITRLDEEKQKYGIEQRQLNAQLNEQRRLLGTAETAIKGLLDQRNQRLDEIRKTNYDVHKMYTWVGGEGKARLRSPVWGPVVADVSVTPENAPFVEQAIRTSLLKFVTETAADRDTLNKHANSSRWGVLVTFLQNPESLDHPLSDAVLSRYGRFKWLSDMFDAPPALRKYLIQFHRMHEIPVFFDLDVEGGAAILREQPRIKTVLTKSDALQRKGSKYVKDHSLNRDTIPQPKKLRGVDAGRQRKLEEDIATAKSKIDEVNRKLDSLNDKVKVIDEKIDRLRTEVRALKGMIPKRNTLANRIESLKGDLREAEKNINVAETERRLEEKLRSINLERVKTAVKVAELSARMAETQVQQDLAILHKIKVQALRDAAYQAEYAASGELHNKEAEFTRLSERLTRAMNELKELKKQADEKAKLTDELKKIFEELPTSLEELQAEIDDTQGRIQALRGHFRGEAAIAEYEAQEREIQTLERKIAELTETRERSATTLRNDINALKKELSEKIAKIDAKFSELFKHFDCPGNVLLDSSSEDLSKWFISICVSFRKDVRAKSLGNTQSGGERSVTTMLFLISLQDLTSCGFRLVDEINQGMDPNNERMVFEQIAKSASQPGLPQYFLITPKLLPDLKFDEDTTVLCVFNGPSAPKQKLWNSSISKLIRTTPASV